MVEGKQKGESFLHAAARATLLSWLREAAAMIDDWYVEFGPIHWRVNRGEPHYGVWPEYPVTRLVGNEAWDEVWDYHAVEHPLHKLLPSCACEEAPCGCLGPYFKNYPIPTYEELKVSGDPALAIADIAIQHKGFAIHAIEIVHKNEVTQKKLIILRDKGLAVWRVPARWILGQVEKPCMTLVKTYRSDPVSAVVTIPDGVFERLV